MRINKENMIKINLSDLSINFRLNLVATRRTDAKIKNIVPQNKTSRPVWLALYFK